MDCGTPTQAQGQHANSTLKDSQWIQTQHSAYLSKRKKNEEKIR